MFECLSFSLEFPEKTGLNQADSELRNNSYCGSILSCIEIEAFTEYMNRDFLGSRDYFVHL